MVTHFSFFLCIFLAPCCILHIAYAVYVHFKAGLDNINVNFPNTSSEPNTIKQPE